MRLIIYLITAAYAFLSPPFPYYYFIQDSNREMACRVGACLYFIGMGILWQRYKKALPLWSCGLFAVLSIASLALFPFIFEQFYQNNVNLTNSHLVRRSSNLTGGIVLAVQAMALLFVIRRVKKASGAKPTYR
ncbi:hypothetical protein [Flaviaesturariibacter terrae]